MKNSWGAEWGENGYIRMKRGVPKDGECGIKEPRQMGNGFNIFKCQPQGFTNYDFEDISP